MIGKKQLKKTLKINHWEEKRKRRKRVHLGLWDSPGKSKAGITHRIT